MTKENFTFKNNSSSIVNKFFGKATQGTASKYSEEDIKRMNKMRHEEGKTCKEISVLFGCAATTVGRNTSLDPNLKQNEKNKKVVWEQTPQAKDVRRKYRNKNREKIRVQNIKYLNTERGFLVGKFNDSKKSVTAKNKKGINIEFDITMENFLLLWEKHKKKYGWNCYYTGLPLKIGRKLAIKGADKRHSAPPNLLSIDRFDSTIGYTADNIVFCRWDFNNRKGNISVADCEIIVRKHYQRMQRTSRSFYSSGGSVGG